MNTKIITALLASLLMVTGLNAQEISTSPVEETGLIDLRSVLGDRETPQLTLTSQSVCRLSLQI